MTIAATYLILASQIADELGGRTDLLTPLSGSGLTPSPIKNAIRSAIAKWERTPFYFNDAFNGSFFSTAIGSEIYTASTAPAIATIANIDRLYIAAAARTPLIRTTPAAMVDLAISTTQAQPTHWSYFNQSIRFYPIPSAVLVIGANYTERLTALSADGDSNAWTTDAFDLIKAEAKYILALEVLHDTEMAARMALAIYGSPGGNGVPATKGYLQALTEETNRLNRPDTQRAVDDPTGAASARSGR